MKLLAIETSCDETACAVVEDGRKILSSVVHTQLYEHRLYGGVVPEIASRRHIEQIVQVTQKALDEADVTLEALDGIAVTYGPGLIGALLVGVNFAKGLSLATGLPLIPVHHIRGHIAANYLADPSFEPPFICLVVSGGHTHIIEVEEYTKFHVVGRTRDDAVGEAFDKVARTMGLPYPGGAAMDAAAREGNPLAFKWKEPEIDGAPYDFSFSGLKTAVLNQIHNSEQKGETVSVPDIAASFENVVTNVLAKKTFRVAEEKGYKDLSIAGGVSANSAIRARFEEECKERGMRLHVPPLSLCGDNAAMIGAQGYYEALAGNFGDMALNAVASISVEDNLHI